MKLREYTMKYLSPILLLAFTACSEDKPTEPSSTVLDTTTRSSKNITWTGVDYIEAESKFRMLSISERYVDVAVILKFKNTHDNLTANVTIGGMFFQDKDGFRLADISLSKLESFTIAPNSSRTYQDTYTVRISNLTIALANSLRHVYPKVNFSLE